ncbi:MAG: carboxylating nicotinate-nucleotide diphosphorylase [Planctomycetaceae bacterium]|nr:carboxylating nicotinate-nucleotide diphosphorylase [Planctomycetaceae bacterium]
MMNDFYQTVWDDRLCKDWEQLLSLAIAEDFGSTGDWTTNALVPDDARGHAAVVARRAGVVAGLPGIEMTLHAVNERLRWSPSAEDGQSVGVGQCVGRVEGPARGLLGAERILLNLLGRLSGIATLTRRYVDAVAGTDARIYDTRKTTPGWRRLEKYAVRCGGGRNHRGGLDEAVLIKDNHLALGAQSHGGAAFSPAEAVIRAREYLERRAGTAKIVEVEVDTLEQLDAVLPAGPDIVLLDNMNPAQLREAVARRNAAGVAVELEASGGVDLSTVRTIAESGVERISVGVLTHSAVSLDFGLDWQ